jgi:hypothetical protein
MAPPLLFYCVDLRFHLLLVLTQLELEAAFPLCKLRFVLADLHINLTLTVDKCCLQLVLTL